ncbi:MAG: hypothetical protein HKO53_12155 [Gemmatimonadetes bacterium]|nr:hypothetical protein [Gemmatimonadota bacterium]
MTRSISMAFALNLVVALLGQGVAGAEVETLTDTFNGSGGLTVHPDGDLYVADFGETLAGGGRDLWRITPDGVRTLVYSRLNGGSGNEFGADGNLYQVNINAGTIIKITPEGTATLFSTGHRTPGGIVFDSQGNLLVANCGNSRIKTVTPDGQSSTYAVSGNLVCPMGMTLDDDGNLYASDFNNGNVVKVTPSGQVSVLASIPGSNSGHLVYVGGWLYVNGRAADQVFRVSLGGAVEVFAGTGVPGGEDGPRLEATFSQPDAMDVSPDGRYLYIADRVATSGTGLNPVRIRRIDLHAGTVRTISSSFGRVKARF